jgi:transcriptional regulator with XRE-family HTH domain
MRTPDERSKFGEWLRELRNRKKETLEEVAKAAGVSYSYIQLMETGQRNPARTEVLVSMARHFEVPALEMLRRAGHLRDWIEEDARLADVERSYSVLLCEDEELPEEIRYLARLLREELSSRQKLLIVRLYGQMLRYRFTSPR